MAAQPKFITFEGVDGSGKSTQAARLHQYFVENNTPSVVMREPGTTLLGNEVRDILMRTDLDVDPLSSLYLFAASMHSASIEIAKWLKWGHIVICDRYFDSTIAYQAYGHGLNLSLVNRVIMNAVDGVIPDITILLDIDPEMAVSRIPTRDKLDSDDITFLNMVRQGYLMQRLSFPRRIVHVNGNRSLNAVHDEIVSIVEKNIL